MIETKTCKSCLLDLETSAFAVDRRRSDGLFIYCRKCNAEKYRVYYNKNRDARRAAMRYAKRNMTPEQRAQKHVRSEKYYDANVERVKKKQSTYRLLNPEKVKETWLKGRYGISRSRFDSMLKEQHGACAICQVAFDSKTPRLRPNVDHDHSTGKVRGLLCGNCNKGIGFLGDSATIAISAAQYLTRMQDPK